ARVGTTWATGTSSTRSATRSWRQRLDALLSRCTTARRGRDRGRCGGSAFNEFGARAARAAVRGGPEHRHRRGHRAKGTRARYALPIRVTFIAGALLLLTQRASAQQSGIFYVYDDLNRLIGVIDQQGNAATYTYDATGNLLRVDRFDAAQQRGPVRITL